MTPEGRWMVALLATTLGACLLIISNQDTTDFTLSYGCSDGRKVYGIRGPKNLRDKIVHSDLDAWKFFDIHPRMPEMIIIIFNHFKP